MDESLPPLFYRLARADGVDPAAAELLMTVGVLFRYADGDREILPHMAAVLRDAVAAYTGKPAAGVGQKAWTRRTNRAKREIVAAALAADRGLPAESRRSDRALGAEFGVDSRWVGKLRQRLFGDPPDPVKSAAARTGNLGRRR